MTIHELAVEIGKAIKADERMVRLNAARAAYEANEELGSALMEYEIQQRAGRSLQYKSACVVGHAALDLNGSGDQVLPVEFQFRQIHLELKGLGCLRDMNDILQIQTHFYPSISMGRPHTRVMVQRVL